MLIGRFYFKLTPSGNLIGEYSHRNSDSKKPYGEAATRVCVGEGWIGEYRTTWLEEPSYTPQNAALTISQAHGSHSLYKIEWTDITVQPPRILFIGEAMLCDTALIGDYTEAEIMK